MVSSQMSKNILKKGAGNAPKSNLLENILKQKKEGLKKFWRV